MDAKLNELQLAAGIARIDNTLMLCVMNKETNRMTDPLVGLEKYAELIIRECIAVCKDLDGEYNGDARLGSHEYSRAIEKHFNL